MPTEIFVFGSNLAGRHGAGAAKYAVQHHGAKYGQGEGLQGCSYAIPTKSANLKTLGLSRIKRHVKIFLKFARKNPDCVFNVTPIGCGLAGYDYKDIAPLFKRRPINVLLPDEFLEVLKNRIPEKLE